MNQTKDFKFKSFFGPNGMIYKIIISNNFIILADSP